MKKKFQLKKPLFNKPSWASPQPISTSEDIFSRSNKSYAVVAENEERRRKKKAKKAAKRAQEIVSDEDADEPKNKKRRTLVVDLNVSDDQDDDESSQSEAEEVKITELPTPQSRPSSKARITPETPTRSKQNHLISPVKRSEPPSSHAEVIDVNDSDNDKEPPRKPPEAGIFLIDSDDDDIRITSTKPKPLDVTNEEVSDEEFAELARQARENARRKRLNLDSPSQSSAGPSQSTLGTSTLLNGSFATTSETPQPLQDPVVSILITSHLPGTDMVIIKRRLNQRLRDVRIAWCNQQGYNDAEAALIVLTFRGRRVFDINTCKSLGIGVDEDGEVVLEGEKDVLGEANRRIHMEATTEVMYLEMQKQEEERHRGEQPEEPDEEEVSEVVQPKPQERQTRIILKAKGLQDFKLIVKDVSTCPLSGYDSIC